MADSFSLTFSTGKNVKLDASLNQIGHKNSDFDGSAPVKEALRYLDEYIAGNQDTLIIQGSGEKEAITESILELMGAFELSDQVFINEIEILDKAGRSLTNLPFIVPKRRYFAYGVYPDQSSYEELVQSNWTHREAVYSLTNDKDYYFSVVATDYFAKKVPEFADNIRLCSIWDADQDQPMCIVVTNQEDDLKSLVINYLERYPKYAQRQQVTLEQPNREEFVAQDVQLYSSDNSAAQVLIHGITKFIEEYIVWQYCIAENNTNCSLSDIYDINGSYKLFGSTVYVTLNVPDDADLARILTNVVERVNQRVIRMDSGERLILRLK